MESSKIECILTLFAYAFCFLSLFVAFLKVRSKISDTFTKIPCVPHQVTGHYYISFDYSVASQVYGIRIVCSKRAVRLTLRKHKFSNNMNQHLKKTVDPNSTVVSYRYSFLVHQWVFLLLVNCICAIKFKPTIPYHLDFRLAACKAFCTNPKLSLQHQG